MNADKFPTHANPHIYQCACGAVKVITDNVRFRAVFESCDENSWMTLPGLNSDGYFNARCSRCFEAQRKAS